MRYESIFKCSKTNLRSILSDSFLEDFMLMVVEKKCFNYIEKYKVIGKLKKKCII